MMYDKYRLAKTNNITAYISVKDGTILSATI